MLEPAVGPEAGRVQPRNPSSDCYIISVIVENGGDRNGADVDRSSRVP